MRRPSALHSFGFPVFLAALAWACGPDPAGSDSGGSEGSGDETSVGTESIEDTGVADGSGDETGGMADGVAEAFLERLLGLWVAPVTSWTSVGNFPTMNMDVRLASPSVVFSRVDLDGGNNLRFAFAFEDHDGSIQLVFRNGGYFQGILRDTRTRLEDYDLQEERFRFCALVAGCAYVDAVFDFDGPDRLDLDVTVMGMMHIHWSPTRVETREAPATYPQLDPQPGDAPFPEMPTLTAHLSWSQPLDEATDAWLILTTTDCSFTPGSCTPSRFIRARAEAGSTAVDVTIDQLHPGPYKVQAVLDRNGNLGGTLFPDPGDTIAVPNQSVEVAATGTTEKDLVLSVDL